MSNIIHFVTFPPSCTEFPDSWRGDGFKWWPVQSEWPLWLHPEASFHERQKWQVWPWAASETRWLPTHRPHHSGTTHLKETMIFVLRSWLHRLHRILHWLHVFYCNLIKVISGQQLPKVNIKEDSIVDPLVRVEIHGVLMDQAKQETRHIENNGMTCWALHCSYSNV